MNGGPRLLGLLVTPSAPIGSLRLPGVPTRCGGSPSCRRSPDEPSQTSESFGRWAKGSWAPSKHHETSDRTPEQALSRRRQWTALDSQSRTLRSPNMLQKQQKTGDPAERPSGSEDRGTLPPSSGSRGTQRNSLLLVPRTARFRDRGSLGGDRAPDEGKVLERKMSYFSWDVHLPGPSPMGFWTPRSSFWR